MQRNANLLPLVLILLMRLLYLMKWRTRESIITRHSSYLYMQVKDKHAMVKTWLFEYYNEFPLELFCILDNVVILFEQHLHFACMHMMSVSKIEPSFNTIEVID